jgi:hypothetical protein
MEYIGLAAKVTPFHILPKTASKESEKPEKVKLSRMVGSEKRQAELVKYKTADKEALCRLYLAFDAVRGPDVLHLNTATLLFSHFLRCLDDKFHLKFNKFKNEQGEMATMTVNGFYDTLQRFLLDLIPKPAEELQMQENYMTQFKKPSNMDCVKLAERLEEINCLSKVLTDDFTPQWTEQQLKNFFFKMMAEEHQVYFLRLNVTRFNSEEYSLSELARDMQLQMYLSQAEASMRGSSRQQRGDRPQQFRRLNNGGRGFGYGGRSSWRPNNGQGYGAGNFGSYQGGRGFSNFHQGGRGNNYTFGRGFGQQGRNYGNGGYNPGRGNAGRGSFGRGRGNGYNSYNGGRGNNGGRGRGNNGSANQQQEQDHYHCEDAPVEPEQDQGGEQYYDEQPDSFEEYAGEQQDAYYGEDVEPQEDHYLDNFGFGDGSY